MEKFSYSKLSTFEGCGFRYKLTYVENHFVDTSSIATDFGTLVHYVEETMGNDIKNNSLQEDENYVNLLINGESSEKVLGIKEIKEKYPDAFYVADKSNMNYSEKANHYLNNGIYFLRDFVKNNPQYQVVDLEKGFDLQYKDYVFHGFIDRVLLDTSTGEYIIEDIKTWPSIDGHDLVTPLQFVFYTMAASEIYNTPIENIRCFYYLPFAMDRYPAGTKGFMKRGLKKIDKLLGEIGEQNFVPKPSPLCHWCPFSATYPNQPEDAKNLCPYYSHWTKEKKDFSVHYEWFGPENHQKIMEAFLKEASAPKMTEPLKKLTVDDCSFLNSGRRFLISRF